MTQELIDSSADTYVWAPGRLVDRLRRSSGLIVVQAPHGFGQSSLVSAWLDASRAAGRLAVRIAPPAPTITADAHWAQVTAALADADGPVDIAIERVDLHRDPIVERRILDLVDGSPAVHVVATVIGQSLFDDPLTIGPYDDTLRADDLLYTQDDLQEMFRSAGLDRSDADLSALQHRSGGHPGLCTAVLERTKSERPLTGEDLERVFADAVTSHVHDDILAAVNAEEREFLVRAATAHVLTVDLAQHLGGGPDSPRYLRDLESAGILDHRGTADGDTWRLPPAVRTELIAVQSAEGLEPAARSALLALHHRDRGEHAAALRCAVDAEDWELAVDVFDQHGAALASSHTDLLRDVLLILPEAIMDDRPGIRLLRAVVIQLEGGNPDPGPTNSHDAADLLDLTAALDPRAALIVLGLRVLLRRLAGNYETAAEQTRLLDVGVRRLLDVDTDAATDFLPFLRMQFGLTYQLAGDFAGSTVQLRLAHRLGTARRMHFVSRNAAGNSALNWAFAGEAQRAYDWLREENQIPPADDWTESLVRIGGAVARALTAIDTLDFDTAGRAVDSLRELPEVVELWPFVTFARCRYAIATGTPALGVAALTEFAEARSRARGTFVQTLLDAIEVEVRLALGDVARARALTDSLSCTTPWAVVAVARTHLLAGDHQSAIITCRKYDWLGMPYARSHLEALVIESAAASRLGRDRDALRTWTHACDIADRTGIRSAFATIERTAVVSLSGRAARPSATVAEFLATPVPEHYPAALEFPQLTEREMAVLNGVMRGLTAGQIAALMFLSTSTIKTHKRTLYRKLAAHTRAEAIDRARTFGFLDT
ncbi:LuxR C-terminal-related transcriptional regulator [Prescottella soli]|uniref:LuxR C-terminal-related transcriptional regulator n=1 Tax=Prescottella soli TaxID=1543852 RepID=A0ABW9FUN9_9NOCA